MDRWFFRAAWQREAGIVYRPEDGEGRFLMKTGEWFRRDGEPASAASVGWTPAYVREEVLARGVIEGTREQVLARVIPHCRKAAQARIEEFLGELLTDLDCGKDEGF